MRILVHGRQAFGKAVLERLLDGPDDVVGIFCPPDAEKGPPDPIKTLALERGLPLHQPASWKGPDALDLIRSFNADLCVMAYVTMLVPKACLDAPAKGSIQYHPSLLPRHRGPSSINWAVIQGDTRTGLSIFWPDDGLDTGPVLLTKTVEIGPGDTVGSLYFDHLFPTGVDAMIEAVELVRADTAPRLVQDESQATYEGWCKDEDAEVNWAKPAAEVDCLIRGTDPQPGAWTTTGGQRLTLFGARLAEGAGKPGEILALGEDGMIIATGSDATGSGAVRIARVRADGSREKLAAAEYAAGAGLGVGSLLGN